MKQNLRLGGLGPAGSSTKNWVSERFSVRTKVIYPKYSKQWLSAVAHTIACVCSKVLNHGLNHRLLF